MSQYQELLDRRGGLWEQMQEIKDHAEAEKRGLDALTAEEAEKWDRIDAEIVKLDEPIARAKRDYEMSQTQRDMAAYAGTNDTNNGGAEIEARSTPWDSPEYRSAYTEWVRGGTTALEVEKRAVLRGGHAGNTEVRAQGTGTTAGGYFIPTGFRAQIVQTMKYFGGVRGNVQEITTDTGNTLPWPTVDDTSNVGAILAENTGISEVDVVLGTAQLGAYKYTSKSVLVSYELLQDSYFDIQTFLSDIFGRRLGRIQNTHFTTGTGTSQPLGIQTNSTAGKTGTTGQTLTVIYDDLIDTMHSVDYAYRQGGNAKWMMNDLSLAVVRKLKDTQGHPLWQPSLTVGYPDLLLGYPVVINNDMPVMAANAKSILFGDFARGYVIRDVLGVQTVRLDERYADALQVGFFAFMRSDATVQDASAYKAYKNSAT